MITKPNDSAFPGNNVKHSQAGFTKREYFAGLAMQALITSDTDVMIIKGENIRLVDVAAVKAADALIAELSKTSGGEG